MSGTTGFPIKSESYAEQHARWPETGRHILAHYDDETIVVYQAYRPAIGRFAVDRQYFGGEFKYTRMSWIKPNFLWMMYRSDWGRSEGQKVVLAIRIRRPFFDSLLDQSVASSFRASGFTDRKDWNAALSGSEVRLQWDPDHLPTGGKCERRAVQVGIRGAALEAFGKREIVEIVDASEFVAAQRENLRHWKTGELVTPSERVYVPDDPQIAKRIRLDQCG